MLKNKRILREIFNETVLVLLLLTAVAIWLAVFSRPDNLLHVYFCDVGQGDAVLIKTPQNHKILVDGGRGNQVLNCLSNALPFYDRGLDLVVLTHPHADHVGGLIEVIRTYQIQKLIFWQVPYQSADFQEFVDLVRQKKIQNFTVVGGNVLALDQQTRAEVWYPLSKESLQVLAARGGSGNASGTLIDPYDGEDVNDSSIVFRLVCGDFETLLTGDAPEAVQKLLLRQGMAKEADVLKVAHQGAKDGADENFLKEVNPRLAVISVGEKNPYGHPHTETLRELENVGAEIRRTDQDGTVEVVSDCKSWWVR